MSDEHYTMGDRMLSEVYLNAIKTCEELEKIQDNKIKKLEKKLAIATKALKLYAELDIVGEEAREALKEMEGVK